MYFVLFGSRGVVTYALTLHGVKAGCCGKTIEEGHQVIGVLCCDTAASNIVNLAKCLTKDGFFVIDGQVHGRLVCGSCVSRPGDFEPPSCCYDPEGCDLSAVLPVAASPV